MLKRKLILGLFVTTLGLVLMSSNIEESHAIKQNTVKVSANPNAQSSNQHKITPTVEVRTATDPNTGLPIQVSTSGTTCHTVDCVSDIPPPSAPPPSPHKDYTS